MNLRIQAQFIPWWQRHQQEIDGILFDVDGTLVSGQKLLPGAKQLIEQLRQNNFPFFLLTNDGNHSHKEKCQIMAQCGLHIDEQEIVSCSDALTPYVKRHHLAGTSFYAMGSLGKPDYAEIAGLKTIRDPSRIGYCRGVIIGEGTYSWQENINAVLNFFIRHPERPLLVPNPDSYWPNGPDGEIGIGAGGKARFICTILREYGIRKKPLYLGKPYPAIFRYTCQALKKRYSITGRLKRERLLMIGDSLFSDIKGANSFGLKSALMMTGITNREHLRAARRQIQPKLVFEKLA